MIRRSGAMAGPRTGPNRRRARRGTLGLLGLVLGLTLAGPGAARADTVGDFSFGQLQSASVGGIGCGGNGAAEPAIRISDAGNLFLGSELGLGAGSQLWRALGAPAGPGASPCALEFRGEPNGPGGMAAGGDIDLAIAPARNPAGKFNLYVASLNGGSVTVAHSGDDGATFASNGVQMGVPLDDRPWIAAYGSESSILTFTDSATHDIDVLRSTDGGQSYSEVSMAIPLLSDYRSSANQIGNVAIDAGSGMIYQSYVAPSTSSGSANNEFFVAVSADQGSTWTQSAIPCSTAATQTGLDHAFPNVAVDQRTGRVWAAWSDDTNVFTAVSNDHGSTWTCSPAVSRTTGNGIFPWLAARNGSAALVFYGTPGHSANPTWYVEYVQNASGTIGGWQQPQQLMPVHTGTVCEAGTNCGTSNRQLFEDFGVDIDPSGWSHIAYSHDAPNLGDGGSYTGYAVQVAGARLNSAPGGGAGGGGGAPAAGPVPGTIALPTGACVRGNSLAIRLHRPRGARIRRVTVLINGVRIRHVRRRHHGTRLTVSLRGITASTLRVEVKLRVRQHHRRRTLTTSRLYHRCPQTARR